MKRFIILASIILLCTLVAQVSAEAKTTLKIGTDVPNIILTDLSGGEFDLSKKLGTKTIVLTFFTTWSKTCNEELAFFSALKKEYKNENLEIITISLDRTTKDLEKFIKDNNYDFTFLPNKKLKYLADYRVLIIPTVFLINPDGTLQNIYVDYDKNVEKALSEDLKKIFKKASS
ncbi:MAG: redoxin domain-containing protein [Candidatus Margulisbacteria bacterium]|nr:redoxin domain-containing protein [Candidatus Margulisiibacteriota bacterium]MBU1022430.1 redoxin domain-containing protein [Candidatus Margulisiibacteriota bacterium]MBU1728414.1 redoxin domain-containing protein [Candidatus Margulisiibacteriota bacterium]MBU1954561.1 redoxin domain-containing protein [Candidatus Margulisiibacteriota bacterium]